MSQTMATPVIPRPLLWLVGLALAGLLLSLAGLRLQGYQPAVEPGAMLTERSLRFSDTDAGHILVTDAGSQEVLATMTGEQGFLRGVLRGLAQARRASGHGTEQPFLLSLHNDGRLILADPATGRRIDLASFGSDNAAVFARWLTARPGAPKT